jgi:hypothetical protein
MGNEESTLADGETMDDYDENKLVLRLESIQSALKAAREEQMQFECMDTSFKEEPTVFELVAGHKVSVITHIITHY